MAALTESRKRSRAEPASDEDSKRIKEEEALAPCFMDARAVRSLPIIARLTWEAVRCMIAKSAREVHEALMKTSQAHLALTEKASAVEAELSFVLCEDEAEEAQQTQSLRACLGALREGKKVDIKAAIWTLEESDAVVQRALNSHDQRSLAASLQNLSALLRALLQQMKSVQKSWGDRGGFLSHESKLANLEGFIQSLEAAELAEDFRSKCQDCIEDLLPFLEVV